MKKIALILIVMSAMANCSAKFKEMPAVGTGTLPLAKADYTISGETSGKACGFYLLHLINFSRIFNSNSGIVGGGRLSNIAGLYQEATYDALSKLDGSTYVISPKYEVEYNNYILASQACVTVKAKGITLKGGPTSNQ